MIFFIKYLLSQFKRTLVTIDIFQKESHFIIKFIYIDLDTYMRDPLNNN